VRNSAAATAAKLFMRIVPHVPARASRLAFTRGYFLRAATAALSRYSQKWGAAINATTTALSDSLKSGEPRLMPQPRL
jgi:hypothetical protein